MDSQIEHRVPPAVRSTAPRHKTPRPRLDLMRVWPRQYWGISRYQCSIRTAREAARFTKFYAAPFILFSFKGVPELFPPGRTKCSSESRGWRFVRRTEPDRLRLPKLRR